MEQLCHFTPGIWYTCQDRSKSYFNLMFIFSVVAHGVYPFAISAISIGKNLRNF